MSGKEEKDSTPLLCTTKSYSRSTVKNETDYSTLTMINIGSYGLVNLGAIL